MRQPAGGPEGTDISGFSPRSSAGGGGAASQQAQAGRSPVLDVAQVEVLRSYGSEHEMAAGDVLFADGDVTYDLIVLLAGEARIVERGEHGLALGVRTTELLELVESQRREAAAAS